MPLSTVEHAAVQRRTKAARNTAAAVRRAASRQQVSGAVVLNATDSAGNAYTLVMTQTEPGRCSCFRARWQHTCPHLEAASLLNAPIQQRVSAHAPAGHKGPRTDA